MSRSCRRCHDLLGPYVDHELDQAGVAAVEEHLNVCAECSRELAEIRHLHGLVQGRIPLDIGDAYAERVRLQVRRKLRERIEPVEFRHRQVKVPWFGLAGAAAGLVIIVIVAVGGFDVLLRRQQPQAATETADETATPPEAAPAKAARPSAATRQPIRVKSVSPAVATGGAAKSEPGAAKVASEPALAPPATGEVAATESRESGIPPAELPRRRDLSAVRQGSAPPTPERGGVSSQPKREHEERADAARVEKKAEQVPPAVGFFDALRAPADTLAQLVQWPSLAEKIADSGTAQVRVAINSDGSVLGVSVARSSGSAELDSLAVRMARAARYQPLVEDGVRRSTSIVVPFSYSAPADGAPSGPPSEPPADDR